jgi:hypothetical protein
LNTFLNTLGEHVFYLYNTIFLTWVGLICNYRLIVLAFNWRMFSFKEDIWNVKKQEKTVTINVYSTETSGSLIAILLAP